MSTTEERKTYVVCRTSDRFRKGASPMKGAYVNVENEEQWLVDLTASEVVGLIHSTKYPQIVLAQPDHELREYYPVIEFYNSYRE